MSKIDTSVTRLFNGKTHKEYFELLAQGLFGIIEIKKIEGNIGIDSEIEVYFNKKGHILPETTVEQLREFGELNDRLKEFLSIDDNWEDNSITIDAELVAQVLCLLPREELIKAISKLMQVVA